jgi:large subunit ribosomal protein L20
MTRVRKGFVRKRNHKKMLEQTKGKRGAPSTLFRQGKQQYMRSLSSSFASRKTNKRTNRSLWIQRISSQVRYSDFICSLKRKCYEINRKLLSQLTILDHKAFMALYRQLNQTPL